MTAAARILLVGSVLLLLNAASQTRAQDLTWINGSASNWNLDPSNLSWDSGSGTVAWTNGSNAIFTGTGETIALGADMAVNHLTFDGNNFVLADSGASGSLALAGPSTVTVTNISHTATISDALPSGALTKAGLGTLVLSGTNAFDGNVTVSAGRLLAASNWALGSAAGSTSVANGAQLALADGVTITGETVSITGSGTNYAGALSVLSNASAHWAGAVTMTSGGRVGADTGGTLTISGPVSGTGPLTVSGFGSGATIGTVVLTTAGHTYTGETQVLRGRLQLGGTNALPTTTTLNVDSATASVTEAAIFDLAGYHQTVGALTRSGSSPGGSFVTNSGSGPSTLTVNQAASTSSSYNGILQDGAGVLGFTKAGSGTVTLSGNNTLSGTITVSAGTLNLAGASSAAGQVVVNAGAVLQVSHNQGLGNTSAGTIANDTSRVVLTNGVTVTGETITISGNGGNNNGALQTADGATATWAGNIVLGNSSRIGGGQGGTLIVSGVISGSGGLLYSRAPNATTILNASSTYTGDTQMFANSGTRATLKMGVDNAINPLSRYTTLSSAKATTPMDLDLNGHLLTLRALDTTARHENGAATFLLNNGAGPAVLTVSDATAANTTIFNGILADGTGGLSVVKDGASTQILISPSTYTGTTTVRAGVLQLGGSGATSNGVAASGSAGALASTQYLLTGGTLALNNAGTNNNGSNRLPDGSTLHFQGGSFLFQGSDLAATNSSETLGTLSFDRGIATVTAKFGGSNVPTLTAGQLSRVSGGGIGFVTGTSLGKDSSSTASVSRIFATSTPTLTGTTNATSTGINAAVKNTKIVPYLLGSATASSGGLGTEASAPNTFVTYEAGTGLRPLNPVDEFATTVSSGNNVRLTADTSVASSTSVNSLIIEGSGVDVNIASGQTLNVASGAILFLGGADNRIVSPGTLDFGSQEGLVTINASSNTWMQATITGTAGMTYHGSGTLVLGGQQNPYSGDTVLRVANVIPQASSQGPAGAPTSGPFGTGTVILDGSSIRASSSGAVTVGNPVILRSDTSVPDTTNAKSLAFTGPVTLENGTRTLTHSSSADTVISGAIGDGGQGYGLTVAGTGTGKVILAGANTYTGATTVTGSTLSISSEANLGANPAAANPAQLTLNGGTLQTTASFAIDDANRGVTVGTAGGTISPAADTTLTVESDVVLSGNLTKAGTGTLLFHGSSSGTGNTTVAAGTLGGNGIIAGNATVQNGATLTAGTLGAANQPLASDAGTLAISGNLTSAAGSSWLIDLVQGVSGVSDTIAVAGQLTPGGATLAINFGGTFAADQKYVIATYGSLAPGSTFAGFDDQEIFEGGGGFYQISYADSGTITLTAIPEPEAWLPAGLISLLGILGWRRRPRGRGRG